MRNFILGVIVTLAIIVVGGLVYVQLGFMPTNADAAPSGLERRLMLSALDASMERRAQHASNPVPPTDENIVEGMKIYTMNCAACHGALDLKPSPLAKSFYPAPPQIVLHPMDDPEWHIHYAIRTGVRYTGMPAWNVVLSDQDIWKVTAFLTRIEKLSPAVQDYWKKSFGVNPPSESGSHDSGDQHDMGGKEDKD
ncbi:MAG TPA: cytochrome c [Terriglobales bacterium]|nr:cytochrome c [Terriglobales bacterium]